MGDYTWLLIVVGVYVVAIIVEFILSARKGWAFGLILPVLSLAAAAVMLAIKYGGVVFVNWWDYLSVAMWVIIYNVGTFILFIIYFMQRRNYRLKQHEREQEAAAEAILMQRQQEINEEKQRRLDEKNKRREERKTRKEQ